MAEARLIVATIASWSFLQFALDSALADLALRVVNPKVPPAENAEAVACLAASLRTYLGAAAEMVKTEFIFNVAILGPEIGTYGSDASRCIRAAINVHVASAPLDIEKLQVVQSYLQKYLELRRCDGHDFAGILVLIDNISGATEAFAALENGGLVLDDAVTLHRFHRSGNGWASGKIA